MIRSLSRTRIKTIFCILVVSGIVLAAAGPLLAEPFSIPTVNLNISNAGKQSDQGSTLLQILLILTVLSLAPAILVMLTSFTRIVVVFSLETGTGNAEPSSQPDRSGTGALFDLFHHGAGF